MSEKIFISYARKDREKTAPITDLFRDKGYSYWMDESNIEAAGLWSEQIVQAIKECVMLVPVHAVCPPDMSGLLCETSSNKCLLGGKTYKSGKNTGN